MILSEIKRYLETRGQAFLNELALHFDVDPEAMRGMLARWIDKGNGCPRRMPEGVPVMRLRERLEDLRLASLKRLPADE